MHGQSNKPRFRQRGIASVEMAITAPLLIFVMLAAAEFTRVFIDHNTLTKTTRNAVRYAAEKAISDSTQVVNLSAGLQAEIRNLAVYGQIDSAGGTAVLPGLSTSDVSISLTGGGNDIEVTVTYPTTGILGSTLPALVGSAIGLNMNLQATVRMRAL